MVLYFITGNENKLKEMKSFIPYIKQLKLDLPEIQSNSSKTVIKAKLNGANLMHPNLEFIVEDTSFYMDALNSFPGTFAKYFLEKNSPIDIYNIAKDRNNFKAQLKTIIGYNDKLGKNHFFEGIINGILVNPKKNIGYGVDPIFKEASQNKTFTEIGKLDKNKILMRRIAALKFKKFYEKY